MDTLIKLDFLVTYGLQVEPRLTPGQLRYRFFDQAGGVCLRQTGVGVPTARPPARTHAHDADARAADARRSVSAGLVAARPGCW